MTELSESKPIGDEMPLNVVSLDTSPTGDAAANISLPSNESGAGVTSAVLPDEQVEAGSAAALISTEMGQPAPTEALPAKKKMLALFVRDEDLKALWDRSARAKKDVIAQINDVAIAQDLLNHIDLARNALLAGRENYELAESYINEVEYRVALSQRVQRASSTYGLTLFAYETVWGLVLLAFLFLVLGPAAFSSTAVPSSNWSSPDVVFLLGSMTWGGLGGVIGAWLSLVRHITKDQDFDRQHLLWYINSPVMGIGVGAVIYLILRAGLLSISGPVNAISSPLVIYLLAWLSGFQQNVFTDMIRRLLQVFKIGGDEGEESPTAIVHPPAEAGRTEQPTSG